MFNSVTKVLEINTRHWVLGLQTCFHLPHLPAPSPRLKTGRMQLTLLWFPLLCILCLPPSLQGDQSRGATSPGRLGPRSSPHGQWPGVGTDAGVGRTRSGIQLRAPGKLSLYS